MRSGTHGFADLLAALLRRISVEDRGEEDRTALSVEVEHLGRIGREPEPVLVGPVRHSGAAALEHGQIERIHACLQQHLDSVLSRGGLRGGHRKKARRLCLAYQPLERPRPTALDAGRDVGQWNERAELAAATQELEGCDVVLYAVVVRRQRGRTPKIYRAVGPNEPGTGQRRAGHAYQHAHHGDRQRDGGACSEVSHRSPPQARSPMHRKTLQLPARFHPRF